MLLHVWQRQHGSEFIAQVELVDGQFGKWRASAWRIEHPGLPINLPTELRLLHSAQAEADALVQETFGHTCEAETCGTWLASVWIRSRHHEYLQVRV